MVDTMSLNWPVELSEKEKQSGRTLISLSEVFVKWDAEADQVREIIELGSASASKNSEFITLGGDQSSKSREHALSPHAAIIHARLKKKAAQALKAARELEEEYPDPVQALVDLFKNMPGDDSEWQAILEEPYG